MRALNYKIAEELKSELDEENSQFAQKKIMLECYRS